jgi:hypothetical protein
MAETFLHGVEVLEIDAGPRPIQTVRSSVIGIIGTAPLADETAFPLNTPVMIAGSRREAAKLVAGAGRRGRSQPSDGGGQRQFERRRQHGDMPQLYDQRFVSAQSPRGS